MIAKIKNILDFRIAIALTGITESKLSVEVGRCRQYINTGLKNGFISPSVALKISEKLGTDISEHFEIIEK